MADLKLNFEVIHNKLDDLELSFKDTTADGGLEQVVRLLQGRSRSPKEHAHVPSPAKSHLVEEYSIILQSSVGSALREDNVCH